jgi:DNA-binding transcriptional ArsR family regulator
MNIRIARALASGKRVLILKWLKDPTRHFRPQIDGDLVRDGVCGLRIAQKLGVSQPTASEHLRILSTAGLLRSRKIKQWMFYRRDAAGIRRARRALSEPL